MKTDLKDIYDLLQDVQQKQGGLKLFIVIALIIMIGVLIVYLKYYTKSIAEEASKRSLAKFESNLSNELQTQIGLFFRDENVRTNLLTTIGTKSFDKKIECWQAIQSMYFEYQQSWGFSSDTETDKYVELDKNLNEIRFIIFNETVYIGYFLSQKMIRMNSLMRNNLREKRTEFIFSGDNYEPHNESRLQGVLNRQQVNENEISDLMYEIEKWIMDKLHSDQTLEKFEFTNEQLDQIKKEREKRFDSIQNL